jgi:hypothetical protein
MLEGAWNAWRFHLSPGKTAVVWGSTSSAGTRQFVRDVWSHDQLRSCFLLNGSLKEGSIGELLVLTTSGVMFLTRVGDGNGKCFPFSIGISKRIFKSC